MTKASFQSELLAQACNLQAAGLKPSRLILGRAEYAILEELKGLYPRYPHVILANGKEHRFGFEITQADADHHFELQGDKCAA